MVDNALPGRPSGRLTLWVMARSYRRRVTACVVRAFVLRSSPWATSSILTNERAMFPNMRAMRIPGRQKDEEKSKLERLGRYGPPSADGRLMRTQYLTTPDS